MEKAELIVILATVRNALDTIELLGTSDYPTTKFKDKDIQWMFYDLNSMCKTLSNKIKTLEAETV